MRGASSSAGTTTTIRELPSIPRSLTRLALARSLILGEGLGDPVRRLVLLVLALAAVVAGLAVVFGKPFPPDTTPEGAYLRVAKSISEDRPRDIFAYLETEAQWAAYSIRDARKKESDRVRATFPEPERSVALSRVREEAEAPDGADVFVLFAKRRAWTGRLRKDLSGIAKTEMEGDRASVVTVRGTRYAFRKRDNGIWGLTMFTADLLAESERATRDLAVVESAAADYERAAKR